MSEKKFKVGMYGGKFMPFHKGHLHCVEEAAKQCEKVYVILFHGGEQELKILRSRPQEQFLKFEDRKSHMVEGCKHIDNAIVIDIDVTACKYPDGTENWEMETPLVEEACGKLDAVFGSEPEYKEYFKKAFPDAEYVMIDKDRNTVPISGTMIRNMPENERKNWIV